MDIVVRHTNLYGRNRHGIRKIMKAKQIDIYLANSIAMHSRYLDKFSQTRNLIWNISFDYTVDEPDIKSNIASPNSCYENL